MSGASCKFFFLSPTRRVNLKPVPACDYSSLRRLERILASTTDLFYLHRHTSRVFWACAGIARRARVALYKIVSLTMTLMFSREVMFSTSMTVSYTVTCVGVLGVDGVGSRVGVPRRGRAFSRIVRFSSKVTLMTVVVLCVS